MAGRVGVHKLIMKGLLSPFSSLHTKSGMCFQHSSHPLYIYSCIVNQPLPLDVNVIHIHRERKGKGEELEEVMGDGRVGKG